MAGTNIITAGDGKLYALSSKGYNSGGGEILYQVTLICSKATLAGTPNSNGLAIGTDKQLITWLAPGDSITLLTRDLGAIVWQDVSGSASVLGLAIELPAFYVLPSA